MMELTLFLEICMAFFATIGFLQGVYREFVATVGIVLGLFVLTQFDWLIDIFLKNIGTSWRFGFSAVMLIAVTYFAYEQAPTTFVPSRYRRARGGPNLPNFQSWQMRLVSAGLGAFNGYLVVGSLWYFMDQYEYPLNSLFTVPALGSSSAEFVNKLPLVWLQQGNLIFWIIVAVFMLIIVFR